MCDFFAVFFWWGSFDFSPKTGHEFLHSTLTSSTTHPSQPTYTFNELQKRKAKETKEEKKTKNKTNKT